LDQHREISRAATRTLSKSRFRIRARLASFVFAARGLRCLVRTEHNAWLHLAASIAVIVTGFWLGIDPDGWRWIILAIGIVWLAEAFNTAIEAICDRFHPEFDPAIGRIKDLAAAAVLVAAILAALIGILTLGPPLLERFA
jgi:diacylglycerol kinase (ATP)